MAIRHKKINYLLFPVVLMIWGFALSRLLQADEAGALAPVAPADTAWMQAIRPVEHFSLNLQYRDPFLSQPLQRPAMQAHTAAFSSTRGSQEQASSGGKPQLERATPKQLAPALPELRYLGGVRKPDEDRMTGILYIDGVAYRIRQGDSLRGFTLLEVQLDQVTVSYQDSAWVVGK